MNIKSILLTVALGVAVVTTSCKKENHFHYTNGTSTEAFAGKENYNVSEAYILSHNFLIADADNAHQNGGNGPLSWKLQGIDGDGNLENMFVLIESVSDDVWWQTKYQPGAIISGKFALSVRKK